EHHFQQVRLFAKTAAATGVELEQVKDTLHTFKNRTYVAEENEREMKKKIGTPEEEEMQEVEDPTATPKDSLIGPVESTDPAIMRTD
ncbi:hypothetical protein FRX31_020216, partial [Thalictrum thalictroides]